MGSADFDGNADVMKLGLPAHLRERVRNCPLQETSSTDRPLGANQFVLYWMRTAVRSDENPALDVARWMAMRADLPLLVYQGISDDYDYASDRHHRFMLEGARDVQEQFQQQGISYAFHLTTSDDQQPRLLELANRAAWMITEDMPVDPPRRFLNVVLRKTSVPTLLVDTACVVPRQVIGRAFTRAFEFRAATAHEYRRRVEQPWPILDCHARPFPIAQLPFEPLQLAKADLATLIARCRIDHSVGPILGTTGGSAAGYRRWQTFREYDIERYDQRRNSPLHDGVSRLSPYLHYGMVSPFRIAREASQTPNSGTEKFLDELLIWRELAYVYCQYTENYDRWESLPTWAKATLLEHQNDPRPNRYTWEQLARGETDDPFWNAAQHSLLMAGELHNNVRMTWGKAFLRWTSSPQDALRLMVDLNHRYALDGRDPASYGGLLWCLGQFDRPFQPTGPILGDVRPRPTEEHARRLPIERYRQHVSRLNPAERPVTAVIGAGIAGLSAARTLSDHGWSVTVFEKSRGVGGRMATRRGDHGTSFDHGAQYFTARDERFQRYVASWQELGLVARWPDHPQQIVVLRAGQLAHRPPSEAPVRYVGVPGMTAIARHLARDLNLRFQTQVSRIEATASGDFELSDGEGHVLGRFERVVLALPAPQAAQLLDPNSRLAQRLAAIEMQPCWATMASFPRPWNVPWWGAFLHDSPLSWASRNATKPGRHGSGEAIVIHATPEWTRQNWDAPPATVASAMLEEFWLATGLTRQEPDSIESHRWRYAIPVQPLEQESLVNDDGRIVASGDWCVGGRVEGGFLSGQSAAGRLLHSCRVPVRSRPTQLRLF